MLQSTVVELLVLFVILYTLYVVVSTLYLSPIAHIPGPKLAALSFWYEFYYDVYFVDDMNGKSQISMSTTAQSFVSILSRFTLAIRISMTRAT